MENKQEKFKLLPVEEHIWDKFASQVLPHVFSYITHHIIGTELGDGTSESDRLVKQTIAELSFDLADAMILERRKRKGTVIPEYKSPELSQPK